MKTPHYKAKYSRSTSRGWHKALSLVLLLTILAGSFPAGGFTALADEVSDADSMIQQEGAQAEGEGAQLLQAPAPDEAAPESIPYESGTDESGTDQSGTDQSGTDESGTVQPEADQSGTDQPEADQSGTDESGTDQSGAVSQSEQPTEEPAAEPAEEPAEPAAEPTAEPAEAQDEPDEIPAEEETVYANSVSGALWLDILEDENSGAQHGDGIRQAEEEPVPDYDVSLYKADDKDTTVQTVKTDSDGQYIFENLKPGTYVVGISTCEKDGVEYLLPIAGITDDNLFADYNEEHTAVYTAPIAVETDTAAAGQNAGLRTPPDVQPRTGSYVVTRDSDGANLGTFTSLQDAVNACPPGPSNNNCTITAMADDPAMGSTVTISSNRWITLTSASPNAIRTITQTMNERHFLLDNGFLNLKNITLQGIGLTGSSTVTNGGVTLLGPAQSILYIFDGATITRCHAPNGGAVSAPAPAVFGTGPAVYLRGGEIYSNEAAEIGGGIYIEGNSSFAMNSGSIRNNTAVCGGGLAFKGFSGYAAPALRIIGGYIANNVSAGNPKPGSPLYGKDCGGGGVYLEGGELEMTGGSITGNTTDKLGGGVYVGKSGSTFGMTGGNITSNHAPSGDGGGIYTVSHSYANPAATSSYSNISIGTGATVSGNTARISDGHPSNYLAFTNRATNRFNGLLLDNNNINYFILPKVTYKVNNSTGTADKIQTANDSSYVRMFTQAGAGFAVPSALEPGKEKFLGWNTRADGQGTHYNTNQSILITDDLTLYAEWDHYRYIVTGDTSGDTIGSYDSLADAVNTCRTTEPCTITATADDTAMGNMVTIPSGKSITLTSDTPNSPRTITQQVNGANGRHFLLDGGKLTLKDVTLAGMNRTASVTNGGVHIKNDGELVLETGATIQKCCAEGGFGGGVHMENGTLTTKDGSKISGNRTPTGNGAGVRASGECQVNIAGGEISGNIASTSGAGIFLTQDARFTMSGGRIQNNTAGTNGAGLCIQSSAANAPAVMSGGSITGNRATNGVGGGVYVFGGSKFTMSGGEISSNAAGTDGGGIYTANNSYDNPADTSRYYNISIGTGATVSGNTAQTSFNPPVNASYFDTRVTNPFPGSLLDNNNINYRGNKYAITYKVNNTTNTPDAHQATNVATGSSGDVILYTQAEAGFVAGFHVAGAIEPGKEKFLGWNTQADGQGTHYDASQSISISDNTTLYAEWDHYRYIVTKDSDSSIIGSYDMLIGALPACPVDVPCTITATEDDLIQVVGGLDPRVNAGQSITLTSDNTTRTIKQDLERVGQFAAHLIVGSGGTLTLKNITLEGKDLDLSTSQLDNGGLYILGGTVIMDAGSVITKCSSGGSDGGGVVLISGSLTMNDDAKIVDNAAGSTGGGVYVSDSIFTMNDNATISGNIAGSGGGVRGSVIMNGGKITGNTATYYGGGVYLLAGLPGAADDSLTMNAGEISGNQASQNGGGIFARDGANNVNPATPATSYYRSIYISSSAKVENNTAGNGTYAPPSNYLDFSNSSIRGTHTFDGELLDNDNINYRNPYYAVIYKANNGNIGTQQYNQTTNVQSGTTTVNAVNVGTGTGQANFTAPANHVFVGWTENADGTGTLYHPGDPITLTGSKTLYAKWVPFVDVTLSKTVQGDYGDRNKLFEFAITIQDANNTPVTGTLDYTGGIISGSGATAPADGTLTLDSAGSATVQLKHGQTVTVQGIPSDGKVRVAETADSNYDTSYWINGSINQSGTDTWDITMTGTNCTVDFLNFRGSVVATGISGGIGQNALPAVTAVLCLTAACCVVIRAVRRRRHG